MGRDGHSIISSKDAQPRGRGDWELGLGLLLAATGTSTLLARGVLLATPMREKTFTMGSDSREHIVPLPENIGNISDVLSVSNCI